VWGGVLFFVPLLYTRGYSFSRWDNAQRYTHGYGNNAQKAQRKRTANDPGCSELFDISEQLK
jgi:hypothetical protein